MTNRSALVIEDDVAVRALVTCLLERAAVTVRVAENGARALEMIRTQSFGVIVLDLMMPEMDGFDFIAVLRSENHELVKRVVVLTAHSERGLLPVFDDVFRVVRKPFDIVDLLQTIESCFASRTSAASKVPENL